MMKFLSLVVLASMAMIPLLAGERVLSPIPLEEGTQWVYEAQVQWTPVAGKGPPGVRSNQFRWTANVVECVEGKGARAAVIHAWPDEVAGMDPEFPTSYAVLLESGNRLYRLLARNKSEAGRLARRLARSPEEYAASNEVYLDLPLKVGKRWDGEVDYLKRKDGWYCWRVETRKPEPIQIKGVSPAEAVVFTLAYRTNPDHQVVKIAPGIGIISFQYEHHGTVASSDVRLIEFKPPLPKPNVKNTTPAPR